MRTTVLEIPSQCAENTHFIEQTHYPEPMQQFLEEVIEVHAVQLFGTHGLKIKIQSPNNQERTSWVLISRGRSRFVDELHTPNVDHNLTSAELLSEQEISKESELCLAKSKISSQETVAVSDPGAIELDADLVSISPDPVYYAQGTPPTKERKWKIIPACSSY